MLRYLGVRSGRRNGVVCVARRWVREKLQLHYSVLKLRMMNQKSERYFKCFWGKNIYLETFKGTELNSFFSHEEFTFLLISYYSQNLGDLVLIDERISILHIKSCHLCLSEHNSETPVPIYLKFWLGNSGDPRECF